MLAQYIKKTAGIEELTLPGILKGIAERFKYDSLFRNSAYLMMSTAIMALFGFIFWIIAARAYSPSQIGFATALISATVLLSSLSQLGFNTTIIRYLPKSKRPNDVINTAIISTALATVAISIIYLAGIHHFAPAFRGLTSNALFAVLFVGFMVMVSLNSLTDSVFIAYRASKYNVIVYTFFGLVKIALPLTLVSFGSYGIFFAYTGSVIVSLALSFYFMYRRFEYRFRWTIKKSVALQMSRFSLANYVSSIMSSIPMLILPSMIVGRLGAEPAAYYYMASTIAALLYIIPSATTQALLAEGSHDEGGVRAFLRGATKLIALLMLPAIALVVVLGQYVLAIFGKSYATSSAELLDIMALNGLVMAANMELGTIMRIRHHNKEMLIANAGYLICTLGFMWMTIGRGVLWAGWSLLGGQIFACLVNVVLLSLKRAPQPAVASAKVAATGK